jgi:hypothetical protein
MPDHRAVSTGADAHPLEELGAKRSPQLATLVSAAPTLGEWSCEIKFK